MNSIVWKFNLIRIGRLVRMRRLCLTSQHNLRAPFRARRQHAVEAHQIQSGAWRQRGGIEDSAQGARLSVSRFRRILFHPVAPAHETRGVN